MVQGAVVALLFELPSLDICVFCKIKAVMMMFGHEIFLSLLF